MVGLKKYIEEVQKEDNVQSPSKICFQRNIYLSYSAEFEPTMTPFIINSKGACKASFNNFKK